MLSPDQFDRQAFGRPLRTFPPVVLLQTALGIVAHTDIVGAVRATEDVAVIHAAF